MKIPPPALFQKGAYLLLPFIIVPNGKGRLFGIPIAHTNGRVQFAKLNPHEKSLNLDSNILG
jgi:hypothetical protein